MSPVQGVQSTRTRRTRQDKESSLQGQGGHSAFSLQEFFHPKDDLPYLPGNKDKSRKEGIPYLDKRVLSPEGSLPPPHFLLLRRTYFLLLTRRLKDFSLQED